MSTIKKDRRKFLKGLGSTIVASSFFGIAIAEAPQAVKLTEDDPMSLALGYKHDSEQIDVEEFPRRVSDPAVKQQCKNCTLYANSTEPDAVWAPCAIFQNKLVAADGWCTTWIVKPAV